MSDDDKIVTFRTGGTLEIRPQEDGEDWEVLVDGQIVTGHLRLQILASMMPWYADKPKTDAPVLHATITDVDENPDTGPGITVTVETEVDLCVDKPQANYEIRGTEAEEPDE